MVKIPKPIFYDKLKKISWIKIYTREYGVQYSEMAILCLSPKAKHHIPSSSVNQVVIPEGNNTAFYIDNNSWQALVASLNTKYTTHLKKLAKYEQDFIKDGKNYLNLAIKISKLDLIKKTNTELLDLFLDYQNKLFKYSIFAWTSFILNNYVAERASSILDKYLHSQNTEDKKQEIVDSLFQPLKRAAVLELQYEIEKYKGKLSDKKFNALFKQYKWLSCVDLHHLPWTKEQFKEAIDVFKKKNLHKKKPFEEYAKQLNINKNDFQYLLMAQRFVFIKDARDDYRRQGVYYILPFFTEIARRMKIDSKNITYVTTSEIINFLKNGNNISQQIINERKSGFVMYLDTKNKIVCLQGSNVSQILIKLKLLKKDIVFQEIKGRIASRGKVVGRVVIVHGINDLYKVEKGSILITIATHPDYTIAMRKAAAIVTDEGGITCHAAIVSREYGIPCIVGTQNATKILKDGEIVEVNALEGRVKKLSESTK